MSPRDQKLDILDMKWGAELFVHKVLNNFKRYSLKRKFNRTE